MGFVLILLAKLREALQDIEERILTNRAAEAARYLGVTELMKTACFLVRCWRKDRCRVLDLYDLYMGSDAKFGGFNIMSSVIRLERSLLHS